MLSNHCPYHYDQTALCSFYNPRRQPSGKMFYNPRQPSEKIFYNPRQPSEKSGRPAETFISSSKSLMLINPQVQYDDHRNHHGRPNHSSLKGVIFLVLTFSTPVIQPTIQQEHLHPHPHHCYHHHCCLFVVPPRTSSSLSSFVIV